MSKSKNRVRKWLCVVCKYVFKNKGRPDGCIKCNGRIVRYEAS